jgi:preprotein translocase subunit SecG
LWIIGYFIALIFASELRLAAICPMIFVLSLCETVIMQTANGDDKEDLPKKRERLLFEEDNTKINYAKAKFIFSIVFGLVYLIFNYLTDFFISS